MTPKAALLFDLDGTLVDTDHLHHAAFVAILAERGRDLSLAEYRAEIMGQHNAHILEARNKLFKDYADGHFMTLYGDVSPPLIELLKAHAAGFKWFTFVEGLDSSSS